LKFVEDARAGDEASGSRDCFGGFEYTTPRQYFTIPEGVTATEFFGSPDHPKRIKAKPHDRFGYPGVAFELLHRAAANESDILLSCPYMELAKEIWLSPKIFPGPAFRTFVRFDLGRLLSLMQTNDDVASRVRLRIAKADIIGSGMLRSVKICGNNVLESYVYKWLFSAAGKSAAEKESHGDPVEEEAERLVRLSEDSIRIHYHDDVAEGVVVCIDKFGNTRFRPGKSRSSWKAFHRFYLFCDEMKVLVTEGRHPVRRAREET
jgi:hypothetical protein